MRLTFLPAMAAAVVALAVTACGSQRAAPLATSQITQSAAGPSASSYVQADEVPPYYLGIQAAGDPRLVRSYAVVRATATGNLIATIRPSLPDYTVMGVAAAADDRTFVLDESRWVGYSFASPSRIQQWQTRYFFLLRLNFAGRPVSLTRLPMTAGRLVTGMALSRDATKLAIAVRPQPELATDLEQVRIYSLTTGAVRTWDAKGLVGEGVAGMGESGSGPDDTGSLSWTADGKWLAFDWAPLSDDPSAAGTWLLNTTLGGTSLLSGSRHVQYTALGTASGCASSVAAMWTCERDTLVTPDGSVVIGGALESPDATPNTSVEFLEYSTATGKVVHVLGQEALKNVQERTAAVLWSNSSGSILIGAIPDSGNGQVGIIRGNTFTPLNVPDDAIPGEGDTW
ncbi:MAG TPA: hypothetical protein VF070_49045 [Streptosporangiaceae bacterium]